VQRPPICDDDERYSITSYTPKVNEAANAPITTSSQANRTTLDEDPPSYRDTMSRPDAAQWQIACAEELDVFRRMKLYEVVEKPPDRKVVDSKWVFKLKRGPDSTITKHKAHVVAKGFTQTKGLDYDETFAPVVKFTTI
jgi:hypothetical protein